MIITAHSGALKTKQNKQPYFDAVADGRIVADALEVDIFGFGKKLFLSHPPLVLPYNKIPLEYAFEFIREHNLQLNCDLKSVKLFDAVKELAVKMGVDDLIYFTGSVRIQHLPSLTAGVWYGNYTVFKKLGLSAENVPDIKKYIDSFGNSRFLGVNLNYRYLTDEFMQAAKDAGLRISTFTVDKEKDLRRLIKWQPDNITTNRPDIAQKIRTELGI